MSATVQATTSGGAGTFASAASTQYLVVGVGSLSFNATAPLATAVWRAAGVFSKLRVRLLANATTAPSSVTFQLGGVDQSLAVSIGSGLTGDFDDTSNTVTVSAGNNVDMKVVTGAGGNMTVSSIQTLFAATSDTFSQLSANVAVTVNLASTTGYVAVAGRSSSSQTTESTQQHTIRAAVTAKNLQAYVSSNARTTTTTLRSRKNTANGAQVLSIGSTATGLFEDTTNTDTLAAGDLFNYQTVTGTGAGVLTFTFLSCAFVSTASKQEAVSTNGGGRTYTDNAATLFFKVWGDVGAAVTTTEANAQLQPLTGLTGYNLRLRLSANARAVTQTVTLRKNAADTAQTCSIGSSATGLFEDTTVGTHDVAIAATDEIDVALATGASASSATIRLLGVTLEAAAAPPATSWWQGAIINA